MKKNIFLILMLLTPSCIICEITRKSAENPDGSATVIYYDNGKEIAKESLDKSNKLISKTGSIPDGLVKEYYDNGIIKSERLFKNDLKEGLSKTYYASGKIESETNFKNNKFNGITRTYYENGTLRTEAYFKDDKQDGISRTYYENGKLQMENNLKDDRIDGINRMYYENGNLRWEGTWKDGKREGEFDEYYDNGKKCIIDIYKEGIAVNSIAFDGKGSSIPVYDLLVKRAKNKDMFVDFKRLRFAFTETLNYDPYGEDDNGKKMREAYDNKQYEAALKYAQAVLDKKFVDLDAHFTCMFSYKKLDKKDEYDLHDFILNGLIGSILNSGDGKTPETAYPVIEVREEYVLFDVLGLKCENQSLTDVKGHNIDKMELIKTKTNEKLTLYFNVDRPMEWMLNKIKSTQEKDK